MAGISLGISDGLKLCTLPTCSRPYRIAASVIQSCAESSIWKSSARALLLRCAAGVGKTLLRVVDADGLVFFNQDLILGSHGLHAFNDFRGCLRCKAHDQVVFMTAVWLAGEEDVYEEADAHRISPPCVWSRQLSESIASGRRRRTAFLTASFASSSTYSGVPLG